MDKWRSKGKPAATTTTFGENSLLPPTRRVANNTANPLVQLPTQDRRSLKKWSIDAFFRKVSSILDAQTSSSSLEELAERRRRRCRGKSKAKASRSSGYAFKSGEGIDYSPAGVYRNNNNNNDNTNNNNNNNEDNGELGRNEDLNANMSQSQSLDALEARLASNSVNSRSSDGSLEGCVTRRLRKDKVKARVEAKRDQLYVGDSSMGESSADELPGNGFIPKSENVSGKRRSRASRTERYLKRMGNGAGNASAKGHLPVATDHRLLTKERTAKADAFQPIDRIPRGHTITLGNGDTSFLNDPPKENHYAPQSDIGVNPLVQQTLQYFSEFDRHMTANQQQQKVRKTYPAQHQRRSVHKSQVYPDSSRTFGNELAISSGVTPPKPPSRDHTSRVLINGTPMDKYQQMLRYVQRTPSESHFIDAGYHADPNFSKHNSEAQSMNHNPARHELSLSRSPPKSPLRESLNMPTIGVTRSLVERNQSPILDLNQSKYRSQPSSPQDYHNPNYVPHKKLTSTIEKQPIERRSSKNLEEALCELEAIYNSLQLGDEDLLERAEKRTMEEFHYKGFTASPDPLGNEDQAFRRKTWTDQTLDREEPEIPDRLKDDMAYRRMHPKERPPSSDGHSSLSSISYLMTSPIPSRREMRYIDPKRKSRRKEPDITLDDVVFRSMQYANNTLKVVEPQPPFGIPLGPITAATESDYLHTNPAKSERSRSPYIPSCEPDIVTDDLAFRNLRKDAQLSTSSRQPSPSLNSSTAGGSNCTSPLSFGFKKKRAVRSLSANLYGLINKQTSPVDLDNKNQTFLADDLIFDDLFKDIPVKYIGRRTSDPELLCPNWQKNIWDSFDVNSNKSKDEEEQRHFQKQVTNSSDVELSDEPCSESSDERISPQDRLTLAQRDDEHKAAGSDMGSSYLSSNCSTPPAPVQTRSTEPFTEQEISVYKKLCQDLENLVQLTKGIDSISTCGETEIITLPSESSNDVIDVKNKPSETSIEKPKGDNLLVVENSPKSIIEEIAKDSVDNKNVDFKGITETSPIKREISMILDNLKSLREDSNSINSSCFDEKNMKMEEENKNTVTDDKSFKEITKEICDLVARDDVEKHEETMKVKEKSKVDTLGEDDEKKDQVDDNLFFRNVQLAKLSGDWKESTPKNNDNGNAITASDRRTSLTGGDSISNWEGELRSCEQRVSMVCNASHMSQLTAKYICYITNHITAQFCLLLVFFLVLLLAIVTVP